MKNTKRFVKQEKPAVVPVVLDQQDKFPVFDPKLYEKPVEVVRNARAPIVDPFDTSLLGNGIPNYVIDPETLEKFPPLATPEEETAINKLYAENPRIRGEKETRSVFYEGSGIDRGFDVNQAWIQTHSGRRFNPLKPNPDAMVIQDIAHALSMQCRFTGHTRHFYSVAQHSVLVSYICNLEDAMWGLLHDASEAYISDMSAPLKHSGKMDAYKEVEQGLQEAVCIRFGLTLKEPPSVKRADITLLATEARDLMSPLHPDWKQPTDPLPFKIEAWDPQRAKDMFMKRFFDLSGTPSGYDHYLMYRDQL